MIGIYKITNNINGKVYVGQSNDIHRRWNQHSSEYEQNRWSDKPLYKAFSKYGLQNFTFSILEECSLEDLDKREEYWIKKLNSLVHHNGYNIRSGGEGNSGENHPRHRLTEDDVRDIRTRYNNHERCKEVEKIYSDRIGHSGFSKVWKGESWQGIMMEVYTPENKEFHLHNTGQKGRENGRSKITEQDVIDIRKRKKEGQNRKDVFNLYKKTRLKQGGFDAIWYNQTWKNIVV